MKMQSIEDSPMIQRIDTTRVAEDSTDRKVAANLVVRRPGHPNPK